MTKHDLPLKQTRKLSKKRVLKVLGGPYILFYALPWLMALLIAGTIAQKDAGLFNARQEYFSTWIFWAGPFPLPGAYLTITAISLSLLVKFLFFSTWRFCKAGIILTHLGVLVLIIGGLLTALTQKEGYIAVREDQSASAVSDYHARVLSIEKEGQAFADIPFAEIQKNSDAEFPELPFKITITDVCANCRPAPVRDANGRHGLAESVDLFEAPPEKDNEANLSGITFTVEGADKGQDGIYAVMEEIPHRPEISSNGSVYKLTLQRAKRPLPFTITLKDFRRDLYPGMEMAKGFASDVIVMRDGASWPHTISMNEPLRFKGYTLYQSSFSLRPDGEYSVFSVVENKGRIYPYLASGIIFAGLLLHILLRLKKDGTSA